MSKEVEFIAAKVPDQQAANEILQRMMDTAGASSVFSEPIAVGDYMVITASELKVSLGFGYGLGGGVGGSTARQADDEPGVASGTGLGGGGGGGGVASGRPVAMIEIGPNGVRVEPIVDPTKIVVAFFTTLLGMFAAISRAKRRAS